MLSSTIRPRRSAQSQHLQAALIADSVFYVTLFFFDQSRRYLCHQNAKVSANPQSLCHTLDQSVEHKYSHQLHLHSPKTSTFSCLETLSCPWVGVCVLCGTRDWSRVCSCISVTVGIKPQLTFVCLKRPMSV